MLCYGGGHCQNMKVWLTNPSASDHAATIVQLMASSTPMDLLISIQISKQTIYMYMYRIPNRENLHLHCVHAINTNISE